MPQLAAFPKAFMQPLCKDGTMRVSEWIDLASTLDIDGLEWYAGFLEMADEAKWPLFRRQVEAQSRVIPMMCCSPDFTHPDAGFRTAEIAKQKWWIDMTQVLGGAYCRVLSGQRRPDLSVEEGVTLAADCIRRVCRTRRNGALRLSWRITTKTISGSTPNLPSGWTSSAH